MLVHPQCPCTRASLVELGRLMAGTDIDAWVLFLRPEGVQLNWERTSLWEMAASIPNVQPVTDVDGSAAKMFGAETSGHVLFYDATRGLRFSGGITASRGHEGPSAGTETLLSLLHGREPRSDRTPTFGCPLNSKETSR